MTSTDFQKLKLLAWKYMCYRKFHWRLTLAELIIPILSFYLSIRAAEYVAGFSGVRQMLSIQSPKILQDMARSIQYEHVYYTPRTRITELNMFLTVKNISYHTGRSEIRYSAEPNESQLVLKILQHSGNAAGIVYLEHTGKVLRYKIRDKNVWNTTEMYVVAEAEQAGPYEPDPYFTSGFLGLQYFMEISWIHTFLLYRFQETGLFDVVQNLVTSVQPFPYPAHKESSKFRNFLPLFIAFVIVVVSLMLLCPLIFIIINEKKNGVQELMKLVGLEDRLVWFSWCMNTFSVGILVFSIVTFIIVYDFRGPDYAAVQYVQWSVVWAIVIFYFLSQIVFCFTFCTIFHNALLAICSFCSLSFLLGWIAIKVYDYHNWILVHLSCLFPIGAFIQAFRRMTYYEMLEIPLMWQNIFDKERSAADASLGFVFVMFMFDTILYSFLTLYIDAVNPGKFGQRKSPFFFLQTETLQAISKPGTPIRNKPTIDENKQLVESAPSDAETILSVENLSKNFGSNDAVKGVSFNLYKNEMLTVVGHDKSGKSTTLSMILGLIEPSEGTIMYRGSTNLLKNFDLVRNELGFCPQENRLFPYFTIMDHLLFYGKLKGVKNEEAKVQAAKYLKMMGLRKNANTLISVISSELKRKTSITIALMGNSEILVLDEPTVGLDVKTKKRVWKSLKELKHDRAIILSTSAMNEADAVGDRIAIMNKGVLICNGSPKFLNEAFTTGYEITLKKIRHDPVGQIVGKPTKDPNLQIVDQLQKTIAGTKLNQSHSEIVFNIPSFETSKFPALFKTLEGKKSALNVDTINVSCLTLESVFLKIGGGSAYDSRGKPLKLDTPVEDALEIDDVAPTEKLKGIQLLLEQNRGLFLKKQISIFRNWFLFLYRVLLPTFLMIVLIRGTPVVIDKIDPPLEFSLNLYPDSIVFVRPTDYSNENLFKPVTDALRLHNIQLILTRMEAGENFNNISLRYAQQDLNSYRRDVLLGIDLNIETSRRNKFDNLLLYNKFARHSLPLGVNMINNVLFKIYMRDEEYEIIALNHPIKILNQTNVIDQFNTDLGEHSPILSVWYILCAFFTIDLLGYITIPIKAERIDGFKHIQLLSGLSPLTYWINTFLFDFVLAFALMVIRLLLFKSFDYYGFFTFEHDFLIQIALISLYLVCGLLFEYSLSFVLSSRYGEYTIFFIMNLICTFVTFSFYKYQTYMFSIAEEFSFGTLLMSIAKYVIFLTPPLNFSLAFIKYIMAWRVNHIFNAYARQGIQKSNQSAKDLTDVTRTPYLEFASSENPNGILAELLFLTIDIFLYAALIYGIEYGHIARYFYKRIEGRQQTQVESSIPEDVLNERSNVQNATTISAEGEETKLVLISQGLRKTRRNIFGQKKIIVDDATFLVKEGECFGIVGPKGSGKTATFKMLTGEMTPSAGESWILNTKLSENRTEYLARTGYCTQSDSFLKEMTGRETICLVANLRGITEEQHADLVEKWSTILDIEDVDRRCSDFSEGDRRKICAAIALIGDPNVVFLDEPVTDVDPISRLSLYTILEHIKTAGQAVVVSSQSMHECEALCDRFTILVKGEMKFIGSTEDLRKRYPSAFSLEVIMKDLELGPTDTDESRAATLKAALGEKFDADSCTLEEESKTSIRYEIKFSVPWSVTFTFLEQIKKNLSFIKEYRLSEKSLDDIFTFVATETK